MVAGQAGPARVARRWRLPGEGRSSKQDADRPCSVRCQHSARPTGDVEHGLFDCCAEPRVTRRSAACPMLLRQHLRLGLGGRRHANSQGRGRVAAVGLGHVLSELGSRIGHGGDNGAGGAVQLLGLLYIAYARAVGRIELRSTSATRGCRGSGSVPGHVLRAVRKRTEIDTLAAATSRCSRTAHECRTWRSFTSRPSSRGLSCSCRCCYMADTVQRDTGLMPCRCARAPGKATFTAPLRCSCRWRADAHASTPVCAQGARPCGARAPRGRT